MLHLDIKKLGRFHQPGHRVTHNRKQNSRHAGWEYVHVAQDDHSRVSFACIQPDESRWSACRALVAALRFYRTLGVTFKRVLTDNARATGLAVLPDCADAWVCAICAPSPIRRAPMARRSALSRLRCGMGVCAQL